MCVHFNRMMSEHIIYKNINHTYVSLLYNYETMEITKIQGMITFSVEGFIFSKYFSSKG